MIEEIIENKLDYASLLCESDPNINLVENYLRDGRLFAYFEKQTPLAFIAAKEINDTTVEIKNLLTLEKYRGHGYGKALIQHIEKLYQNKLTFLIGTANSSMTNMLFQSTGHAARATFLACNRQGVYFLPLILILPSLFGITGVQITQPISDILSFLTCIPFLYLFMKKLNKLEKEKFS